MRRHHICYTLVVVSALGLVSTVCAQTRQQRAGQPNRATQQVQGRVATPPQSRLYQQRNTWYEFLLKQFNPDNLDYGDWLEQRRQAFLEARLRNPYFGYSLVATLGLVLTLAVYAKLWLDHRRAMWVTAEMMTDVYNHDLYSREVARRAIARHNDHIERCNRAVEAGQSGQVWQDAAQQDVEGLRAELQRVAEDLNATKHDKATLETRLQAKDSLLAELSLRLDNLSKKTPGNGNTTQKVDLTSASPDLIRHINSLQEQLHAERQKNRQLKGA